MKRPIVITLATLAALGLATGAALGLRPEPPAPASPAGKIFVTNVLGGVQTRDARSGQLIADVETGLIPHAMLLSPDNARLYVSNIGSQSVSVLDTESGRKIKDLIVGEMPDNAAHRALPPAKRGASCFECHSVKSVGTSPNALAWTPDEKQLMVTETKLRSIAWLDPESGETIKRHRYALPGRVTPAHILVHPRSKEIWVFHRYEDFLKDQQAKAHPVRPAYEGQHPSWITVHSPDFSRELARLEMKWEVPSDTALSADGDTLYVSFRSSNMIGVFDTRKRQLVDQWEVGTTPTGLALSLDGKELYTACTFSVPAVLQVIDTQTGEVTASLGIPPSPLMLALDPATGHVFVTLSGTNVVLEIDPKGQRIVKEHPAGHQPLGIALAP